MNTSLNQMKLAEKIRPATEEDFKNLPKYSYSGLSMLKHCPYQFNLKYNENKRSEESTLALQLGTLLHYVLEQKGKMIRNNVKVDYDILRKIMQDGTDDSYRSDDDEKWVDSEDLNTTMTYLNAVKPEEEIKGIAALKKEYWETWSIPDSEGRTYDEKLVIFNKVLSEEMESNDGWTPALFEHPFDVVYDNRVILHGFIDRVDINLKTKEYRVIDYKTNKKTYDSKELATPLQFGIYALAILNEFKQLPVSYQYRLILLDQVQDALTPGWENRFIKAMDKLLDLLDESKVSNEWIPKPTPLCHWCSYCWTNPDAKQYKAECPYYSKWTPTNKTFEVNTVYDPNNKTKQQDSTLQKPRTVIF